MDLQYELERATDKRFRLAVGSFVEEYNNKVQIVALNEETSEFAAVSTFDHPYPTTKIMWIPDSKGLFPDLVATSGDYLRVWRVNEAETRLECLLNNVSRGMGKVGTSDSFSSCLVVECCML
ncbi:WD repeat-containing protein 68 [Apostichopus japonicus]|uniref:WD repeat-containing protein 68 n=1 Tax=Stichopus japonicus TaxID=307972 RepID=A0A2G8JDW6_STIJA|nr:WD repeat-containing protein 68 [Apostichopus japonicus]